MVTFRQAVERGRNDGLVPPEGPISGRDLTGQLQPTPRGSMRALQDRLYQGAAVQPWAVILCRFKGAAPDAAREAPIEQLYRGMFTRGSGGLVEFWRDASLGKIDVSGSRVFGWTEVDLPRDKANAGSGATRSTLVDAAIRAVHRDGQDPETGFHSQIAVYLENWSIDGVPAGLDWSSPQYGMFWIDGSADGRGKVTLTPPHDGNITAHEMGHGFQLGHDIGPDLKTEYQDPCCIMSQQNAFLNPPWNVPFGPAICLPHLVQKGWMYARRLYVDPGGWMGQPGGVEIPLAALTDPGARANLGIKLAFERVALRWDYYLEYVVPTGWDRGLSKPSVFVRRMAPYGPGETPAHLGTIEVPPTTGMTTEFVEPSGNVRFTVSRVDDQGRILRIGAIKQ